MQEKGLFVTGTDTGVGKTAVCAALIVLLRKAGFDAVPMKPVQTGAREEGGHLRAPDLEFCLAAAGLGANEEAKRLMAPFRFRKPCSPHLASAYAGTPIDFSVIMTAFRKLESNHQAVIVEGAGGILVPTGGKQTMLDLMVALGLPVVLAARPGLGTINHTLLSLRVLRDAGLAVRGVVMVETEQAERGDIEKDNIPTIERLGGVRVLGRIPFITGLNEPEKAGTVFAGQCARELPTARDWIELILNRR